MSERRKCSHCDGSGSTTWSCCNEEALGRSSRWGGNSNVRCCVCGGSGWEKTPEMRLADRVNH